MFDTSLFHFLLLLLAFGFVAIFIYAITVSLKLWFYKRMITMISDFMPFQNNNRQHSSGSDTGGCILNLVVGMILVVLIFFALVWLGV